jgi:CRP-like cAMP-binding protein
MPVAHFLHHVFTSQDFTPVEQEEIISQFRQVNFAKNDYLIKEGNTAHKYWFVEQGFIRAYVIDILGNDISTNFYAVGDLMIDWISFFQHTPAKENIQAMTDAVVWEIDFDKFQKLYHSIKAFNEHGRGTMVQGYFTLKQHSIAMLTDHAKERYVRLLEEKPHIIQNVSLKHIATYLGITDTSLSRIRKELLNE